MGQADRTKPVRTRHERPQHLINGVNKAGRHSARGNVPGPEGVGVHHPGVPVEDPCAEAHKSLVRNIAFGGCRKGYL